MGYVMRNGKWADTESVVLLHFLSRASTTIGSPMEAGDRATARLSLIVDDLGADGKVEVVLETSTSPAGPWRAAGAFEPRSEGGEERKCFAGLDRWIRASAKVTGPAATVLVGGELV